MISGSENVQNPSVVNEFSVVVTVIKIVILVIFLFPLAQYTIDLRYDGNDENTTDLSNIIAANNSVEPIVELTKKFKPEVVMKSVLIQPSCPDSDKMEILHEIYMELITEHEFCTPGDISNREKHKVPKYNSKNKSKKEAELPTIIVYAVGGLLSASIGAALMELYVAKKQPAKKNGKNPLSRKCSLAELTVLKHQRKEMLRRDSLMELPEENLYALGSRPPPLQRRCSFPIGTNISPFSSCGTIDDSRRPSIMRQSSVGNFRGQSVIFDSRRQSIIIDSRRTSLDYGGISIEGSPERKHRARLVTRH